MPNTPSGSAGEVRVNSRSQLAWLRDRERAIVERIRSEEDPSSRVSKRLADRRARRDALAVIRQWIRDIEALCAKPRTTDVRDDAKV